ncbi:MAG: maltose alpha-D-glucosyltransferase [Syntrophales bacterium]|nr:maltose alpha-D-glucosyltransferase [Syntrophales bacterium]
MKEILLDNDPQWYKDAIIYELHVKAFYDSTGDGVGDFRGLLQKLDYLEGLGITAIWLLPFYPSPQRDDGYDIADYFDVHPDYGRMRDFKEFLREAHRRGIRVITELVLNHTSNESEWFKRSRQAKPGSSWRNMYVWSNTAELYQDARIIFKDFEASNWRWDPTAQAYYWHRFYSHQPDLNYENPAVHRMMFKAIDFWLSMGVDGLRLDAVPYLYERDGTNCENLPETHEFLKTLRGHIDSSFNNKMLLAEANQWPEDAAAYFGAGDECHMAFHFPLMPRMFMAIQMEDGYPIIDILKSTPSIPDPCQWAIFLRNHDELTLEMVTDEERDYMYNTYARDPRAKINLGIRRRLAPLLGNNRKKIELMNILFFSFPGTPVIYYGDELGMGDNYYLGDRNGVRTPMQWNPDRNAGFSKANPQQLYMPLIIDPEYHYETVNVENQEKNLSSLLWWMKRVIAMRRRYKAFSRGSLNLLSPNNPKVLAFSRKYQDEIILVFINLSRFSQAIEIDLSPYAGLIPEEIFSGNKFPLIRKSPYLLTFGPHSHYWLLLRKKKEVLSLPPRITAHQAKVDGPWELIFSKTHRDQLEQNVLSRYLHMCRWFGAKAKTIIRVRIIEDMLFEKQPAPSHMLVIEVSYNEGAPELYLLPVSYALKGQFNKSEEESNKAIICHLVSEEGQGILYDGLYDDEFRRMLLQGIIKRKRIRAKTGELVFYSEKKAKQFMPDEELAVLSSRLLTAEQSNTSVVYGDRLYLKLYRRLGEGLNPDAEVVRRLTETVHYPHIPQFAGAIELRRPQAEPITIAMLQHYVSNTGDAWTYTLDVVAEYFERVLSRRDELRHVTFELPMLLDVSAAQIPPLLHELIGNMYLDMASLLGQRTAELHLALSSGPHDEAFAPEPFTLLYQKSRYQSMDSLVRRVSQAFKKNMQRIPPEFIEDVNNIRSQKHAIISSMQKILKNKLSAFKTRIHGDYHLGQVLYTGKDFVIIDFEGEPARTISERRLKYSPLRDVAGMIRSFHYAAYATLFFNKSFRKEDSSFLEQWIEPWYLYVCRAFLEGYMRATGTASFMPQTREELEIMLKTFLLEKAIYELGYELNNRPEWVIIPIKGINHILRTVP